MAIGARPVLENNFREDDATPDRVREVCRRFWDIVDERGGGVVQAFEDRKNTVIGTPAVIAALGAIAHECGGGKGLPNADDLDTLKDRLTNAIVRLEGVAWSRGEPWSGLCGRIGSNGKFRVSGGAKDGVYDVYRALTNPEDEQFDRIRQNRRGAAVSV